MNVQSPVDVFDASATLPLTNNQALVADGYRTYLCLGAAAHTYYFSFTNPSPAAGAAGSFAVPTTSAPIQISPVCPKQPLYITGTSADVIPIMVAGSNLP